MAILKMTKFSSMRKIMKHNSSPVLDCNNTINKIKLLYISSHITNWNTQAPIQHGEDKNYVNRRPSMCGWCGVCLFFILFVMLGKVE